MILGADRGAISIYTKKGKLSKDWRQKGFESITLNGYTPVREFLYPEFIYLEESASVKNTSPVLLWEPNLEIKDNKAMLRFVIDKNITEYMINAEGVDSNGKLFCESRRIKL